MKLRLGNLAALYVCLIFTPPAFAGGAIQTNLEGIPLHWQGQLVYNLDRGGLKNGHPVYDHARTRLMIEDAFQTWTSVLESTNLPPGLQILEGAEIPFSGGDIDEDNFSSFFDQGKEACYDKTPQTPCITPIVLDANGEIIDAMLGECAKFSVLGFAGFDDIDDGSADPSLTIVKRGQALFSGACLAPEETKPGCGTCQRALASHEMQAIIVHELGHMLGMDHSQVNPQSFQDCVTHPEGCNVSQAEDIPTMFPHLVQGAAMHTLHRDDETYFKRLYAGSDSTTCSVRGKVFARDGLTEVRGVEVVARNIRPEQRNADALSFISGAEASKKVSFNASQGNCERDCGAYYLSGLRAGESYQLCIQKILPQFSGGSSIEPVSPPFQEFSEACLADFIVNCECDEVQGCIQFEHQDIVSDADPRSVQTDIDISEELPSQPTQAAGGCRLSKPAPTLLWKRLRAIFKTLM